MLSSLLLVGTDQPLLLFVCVCCMYVCAVVSDAGCGGQVLLDSLTFCIVKDRLEELGQVRTCNGLQDHAARSLKLLLEFVLPPTTLMLACADLVFTTA